jgi:hypothetical protein
MRPSFLIVYVDHVAGVVVFVAEDLPHLEAGGRVQVTPVADAPAHEDAVDCGRREDDAVERRGVRSEASGPVLALPAQGLHQVGDVFGGPGRAGLWAAGMVV